MASDYEAMLRTVSWVVAEGLRGNPLSWCHCSVFLSFLSRRSTILLRSISVNAAKLASAIGQPAHPGPFCLSLCHMHKRHIAVQHFLSRSYLKIRSFAKLKGKI
jgi:hypothetical protein